MLGASPMANAQTTWYVDCTLPTSGDGTSFATAFNTIQEGMDAAYEGMFTIKFGGDTVLVADGTCYENLVWPDEIPGLVGANFLTLQSVNGADSTTIDGSMGTGDSHVISFAGPVGGLGNFIDGFTLTNPTGDADVINVLEGILCDLTVENCILSNGSAGIGMLAIPALGRIRADNCTFRDNGIGIDIMDMIQFLFYTPTFTWITNCTFENNTYGAIKFMGGNCEITGNEIRNNYGGPAVMITTMNLLTLPYPTTILIADNIIENNEGGGILAFVPELCDVTISGNTVSGNSGPGGTGMLNIAATGPGIMENPPPGGRRPAGNVVISQNTVGGLEEYDNAIGIWVTGCGATIEGNTVYGSVGGGASSPGDPTETLVSSGIALQGQTVEDEVEGSDEVVITDYPITATIRNNVIYENSTGVFADYTVPESSVTLINNTIADNIDSGVVDGAVANQSVITNCIVSGNGDDLVDAVATYSNIGDGDAGTGNISIDPQFIDAGAGNYHLEAASPSVDVGLKNVAGSPATDIDGEARVMDGNGDGVYQVDMGADEVTGPQDPCGGGGGGCTLTTIDGNMPFGANQALSLFSYLIVFGYIFIIKRLYSSRRGNG